MNDDSDKSQLVLVGWIVGLGVAITFAAAFVSILFALLGGTPPKPSAAAPSILAERTCPAAALVAPGPRGPVLRG